MSAHIAVVIFTVLVWIAAVIAVIYAFSFGSRLNTCETQESPFCPSIACADKSIPTRNNGKDKYQDIF